MESMILGILFIQVFLCYKKLFIMKNLDFNIDTVLLYAIYAVIMGDIEDKFKKIDCYIKGKNIDIRDCKNLGIEEIPNLDKFYEEWLKYKNKSVVLTKEGEKLAESLIEEYIK